MRVPFCHDIIPVSAWSLARARGLEVRGTLGVVLHAKRRGLIERATPLFDGLARYRLLAQRSYIPEARELADEP
ncbi:MAG: DUF3368 domain-containing protein [Longimicrobiales bacterium]